MYENEKILRESDGVEEIVLHMVDRTFRLVQFREGFSNRPLTCKNLCKNLFPLVSICVLDEEGYLLSRVLLVYTVSA